MHCGGGAMKMFYWSIIFDDFYFELFAKEYEK